MDYTLLLNLIHKITFVLIYFLQSLCPAVTAASILFFVLSFDYFILFVCLVLDLDEITNGIRSPKQFRHIGSNFFSPVFPNF